MMHSRRLLIRLAALFLGLLLTLTPALAEGVQFTLRASVNASALPEEPQLAAALSQLLDAAALEGSLVTDGGSFMLDTALVLRSDASQSQADVQLYGIDSHWGVRSSLLGKTELMINCAALLPFGMKAHDYLGLPLDAAALLVPYVHTDAFAAAMDLLAPLFPAGDGKTRLTRAELNALITGLDALCDTDPALSRYLEVTGLYRTVKHYCRRYFDVPEWILPSVTVRRDGSTLTWTSGLLTLLELREKDGGSTLSFWLPTLASVDASVTQDGDQLSGSITVDMDSLQADISFTLPTRLTGSTRPVSLIVDAASPLLPEDGVHLRISGNTQGNSLTLHLLAPDSSLPMATVTGTLIPFAADALPDWSPTDFTGMNVLSVNADSLMSLLADVKWPLITGLVELLAAAPAPAVQTMMDYAEDAGFIDMLTTTLQGGEAW